MPVWTPQAKQAIFNGSGGDGGPRGQRATFLWNTQGRGIPRRSDLLTVRALEESHAVALPLDTVLTQITTTDYGFQPPDDVTPTTAHENARERLLDWFEGGFNSNRESFDHFLKQVGSDLLSVDAGVIELVPDERGSSDARLAEMYARDGATFTKDPDDHNRLPDPESGEPAYWQFSMAGSRRKFDSDRPIGELAEHVGDLGYGAKSHQPVPFTRDEIVWLEESPKPWKAYGTGRVQKVKTVTESVLNMDLTNRKHFDANEIPEGVLSIVDANQSQIDRTREYWNDEIKGEEHKLPILGGDAQYQSFRASPTELNFLESQKWYHKLIWMIFGVSQAEVGLIEDVNRAAHAEASTAVWRKTTKPLLELIEQRINNAILPFHPVYHDVGGEIRFSWNFDNPEIAKQERERQRQALESGTATINEVRQERGEDDVEWGDWPLELVRSTARNHPDWFLERLGVDDPPSPVGGGGDLLGMSASTGSVERALSDGDVGGEAGNGSRRKDPLRNEQSGEYPPLKGHADQLETRVGARFADQRDDLEQAVEDAFPDEREEDRDSPRGVEKGFGIDVDKIVDQLGLADVLTGVVTEANLEAMGITADFEAGKIEQELEDELDEDDVGVGIDFDVEDSFAAQQMERSAAQKMVTVEQSVKDRIRNVLLDVADDGGNVTDATRALRETFDELTDSHARLVARTETMSSSRHGSQALAETSDVVGGKEWVATDDSRTRSWHAVMDGEQVPVDGDFVVPSGWQGPPEYQPSDYPRTTHVVGEDQPFNCRCVQRSVLAKDMPDDPRELAAVDGVTVTRDGELVDPLSERQIEAKREHAEPGETFGDLVGRVFDEQGSVEGTKRALGLGSKHTAYKWLEAEIDGFSR